MGVWGVGGDLWLRFDVALSVMLRLWHRMWGSALNLTSMGLDPSILQRRSPKTPPPLPKHKHTCPTVSET